MPKYAFELRNSTPTIRRVIEGIPNEKIADEIAEAMSLFSGRSIMVTLIVPDMIRIEAYRSDIYTDYATAQNDKGVVVIGTYKGALLGQRDMLQIIKETSTAVLENSVSDDDAELRLLAVDHDTGEILNHFEEMF